MSDKAQIVEAVVNAVEQVIDNPSPTVEDILEAEADKSVAIIEAEAEASVDRIEAQADAEVRIIEARQGGPELQEQLEWLRNKTTELEATQTQFLTLLELLTVRLTALETTQQAALIVTPSAPAPPETQTPIENQNGAVDPATQSAQQTDSLPTEEPNPKRKIRRL